MSRSEDLKLPREAVDRVTKPLARFLKVEATAGGLLLLAVLVALAMANSPWRQAFLGFWETPVGVTIGSIEFTRSLHHWINDGLMTLFFFVFSLELKRAIVLGELRTLRRAALPFAGAVGGMVLPVLLYLAMMAGQPGMQGWGTVMATDTAFVIGCLALFGRGIPTHLRLFLLSLAIFDDIGAILVVALGYGATMNWMALGLGLLAIGVVAAFSQLGVRAVPAYFLLGVAIWLCVDASGIHATITGVVLGLMAPTRVWVRDILLRAELGRVLAYPAGEHWSGDTPDRRDLREAGRAITESLSPVERLEIMLHPWVGFAIMPIFALANAGIPIYDVDLGRPVSLAIIVGLVLGKPIGVFGFSWLAVRSGVAVLGPGLSWPFIAAGACLTGIGFTMSLFIAGLAFDPTMLNSAKFGTLIGSTIAAIAGLSMLVRLTIFAPRT
ncbi:Na+/H+ antiporter NhaA [Acuticoccus sediminis]|uniref:Na(+)/H(+) antiporter NhaA n=1 Tax=Acuticoccus sediminis TaxID=2184697 RepID=A0A8B2NJ71_9HYPH|nr:Na+/H+ antiporter NhaA [Acuticoccus sediminis]RAH95764.1 Na+/H+ antiporter NhaA [Acuticoccus sediminis]